MNGYKRTAWISYAASMINLLAHLVTGSNYFGFLFLFNFALAFICFHLSDQKKPAIEKPKPEPNYGVIAMHEHEFDILPHVGEQTQKACGICRARKQAERQTKFREQQDKYTAEDRAEWLKNKRAQYGVIAPNEIRARDYKRDCETVDVYSDNMKYLTIAMQMALTDEEDVV